MSNVFICQSLPHLFLYKILGQFLVVLHKTHFILYVLTYFRHQKRKSSIFSSFFILYYVVCPSSNFTGRSMQLSAVFPSIRSISLSTATFAICLTGCWIVVSSGTNPKICFVPSTPMIFRSFGILIPFALRHEVRSLQANHLLQKYRQSQGVHLTYHK